MLSLFQVSIQCKQLWGQKQGSGAKASCSFFCDIAIQKKPKKSQENLKKLKKT